LAESVVAVGFLGDALDDATRRLLLQHRFAGYILFARNLSTLEGARALTDELRALHPTPPGPIIAIDQEGGRVMRIRDGVEPLPSMMAVGSANDLELTRKLGEQIAHDLRRVGANLDFAPVLDLAIDPASTIIGTRSFGDNPEIVARLAGALAGGMGRGGIVPTFKHFPGHGSTAVDSHLALPTIMVDPAILHLRDLAPFSELLPHARAAMSAHVVVEAIDPTRPATLSPEVMRSLLRETCAFNGVLFTDDLEMGALARFGSVPERALAAIAAGADCAVIGEATNDAIAAGEEIETAIARGTLREWRLREAAMRLQMLRSTLSWPLALDAKAPHPGIGAVIAAKAIARARGNPKAAANDCIVVSIDSDADLSAPAWGKERISIHTQENGEVERALSAIATSGLRPIILSRRSHLDERAVAAIAGLLAGYPDSIFVSTLEPFDIVRFPQARHILCAFGEDALHMKACADALFTDAPFQGHVPVHLPRA